MTSPNFDKSFPGMAQFLVRHGHLLSDFRIDADQALFTTDLSDRTLNSPEQRDVLMKALIKNAANSPLAIQRSSTLAHWSTMRPQWKEELFFAEKNRIAHAELDLLQSVEKDFILGKIQTVFAPRWGDLYWTDLMNPMRLHWMKSDPAKNLKFSLLPVHDFHSLTASIGDSYSIVMDASMQPILYLMNCFMLHLQNHVRNGKEPPIKMFLDAFYVLLHQFVQPTEMSKLPLFSCLPKRYTSKMGQLAKLQVQFLMAHEFGHVALDHNSDKTTKYFEIPLGGDISINALTRSHQMEFEADVFAFGILKDQKANQFYPEFRKYKKPISLNGQTPPPEKEFDADKQIDELKSVRLAVELLFVYLTMFESVVGQVREERHARESHPSAKERLARLRRLFPSGFHRAVDFVDIAQSIADVFSEYVKTDPSIMDVREMADCMKEVL